MNKLLLGLVVTVIVIATIAMTSQNVVALDFDNSQRLEGDAVIIENIWGLPLVGEDLAKLTTVSSGENIIFINDPNVCGSYNPEEDRGYNCLVAEYTIESYGDYDKIFDEDKFYDINRDMIEIEKEFTRKYKVLDGKKEVPDYREVCKELINKSNSCSLIEDGFHLEDKYKWVELEDNNIKEEIKTFGIFTDLKSGEHTEWIPKIMGEEITAWLDFSGYTLLEYNIGVDSNSDEVYDDLVRAGHFVQGQVGPAGNWDLKGIGLWLIKAGTPTATYKVMLKAVDGNNYPTGEVLSSGTFEGETLISTLVHHNVTMSAYTLIEGINYSITLNATTNEDGTGDCAVWHMTTDLYQGGGWGRSADGGATWTIQNPTDFGLTVYGETADSSPTATQNVPINYYNSSSSDVTLNCSSTDDNGVLNLSLFIGGVFNLTVANTTANQDLSLQTTLGFPEGLHNWSCNATDTALATGGSGIRFFTVDTTDPVLDIIYPTTDIEDNYTTSNNRVIILNWSSTDTNLGNCWYFNNTANVSVTCGDNATFTLPYETYKHQVYANDSSGNIGNDSITITYSYKMLENSKTYNSSSYETDRESFVINVTKGSGYSDITNGYLWYNGTRYSATETDNGNSSTFIYSFGGVPLLGTAGTAENRSLLWEFELDSTTYLNSSSITQYVNPINLTKCLANSTFINVTFADQKSLAVINASMVNEWEYYLGDGSAVRTNTYQNLTYHYEQGFCFAPIDRSAIVTGTSVHENPSYPQREYNYAGTYTNITTNITVYLLGSGDGIYTTFQVLSSADQPIKGVTATVVTIIDGSSVQIDAGITGDDGGVTFWVNPDASHTFTFSKTGYTDKAVSVTPTQSTYTVYLSGGAEANITQLTDSSRGISYDISPIPGPIIYNTNYTFMFNLTSNYWDLDSWGYTLWGSGTQITENSSTVGTGGSLSSKINSADNSSIDMYYYWVINGTYINSTSWHWFPINITDEGYGIKTFVERWSEYMDDGLFGATSFTKYLLIFLLMFGLVGMMAYTFGITDFTSLAIIIATTVTIFDAFFGLLPSRYVLTTTIWFITIATLLWRSR